MPNKPLQGLTAPRRSKPRTQPQKKAATASAVRDVRLKNLEKARRKRKSNLKAQKKAATAS